MASVWKGSLSFGLVSIPVELRPAVRKDHVSFRLLYRKDLTPVKYERFSAKGDGPLAWKDIVKGYEYDKGEFVVLTDEDFREAALGKSSSIEILDFVEQDDKVVDLMARLSQSLAEGKGTKATSDRGARKKTAARAGRAGRTIEEDSIAGSLVMRGSIASRLCSVFPQLQEI